MQKTRLSEEVVGDKVPEQLPEDIQELRGTLRLSGFYSI